MDVRTLNDLFFRAVGDHDKADAFLVRREGAWHPVSHRDALQAVAEVSLGLAGLGVGRDDRVAIFSENRLEWALADFAILTAGAVNVPIYPTLPAAQVEYILNDSGASVVIVSSVTHLARIEEVRSRLRPDLRIVGLDASPAGVPGGLTWDELREAGRKALLADRDAHRNRADQVRAADTASIIYTSGTTGPPKGVVLTHGNIVSNVIASLAVLPIGVTDSCLSFLPLCHIFERMAGHFTMFHAGATIAYAESMETVPKNLVEVRPTVFVSVPRLYEKMHAKVLETVAAAPPIRRRLFHWAVGVGREWSARTLAGEPIPAGLRLRHAIASRLVFGKIRARLGGRIRFMVSGGAPLRGDLVYFFHAAGLVILEGYGLTETSPVIACNRLNAMKPGTVGQPIPGVLVRIGPDGEILIQSPGVMREYFKRPADTAQALEGGWFHTGDIGALDPDGFLSITDRKKDLIVTAGGKKVAPQPLENRLREDPYIADAVVLGDGRPYIVALIVPEADHLAAWARSEGIEGDLPVLCADRRVQEFLEGRALRVNEGLASFEQIKRTGLIDRPLTVAGGDLTPSLKIRRRLLTENFAGLIDSLYPATDPVAPWVSGPAR